MMPNKMRFFWGELQFKNQKEGVYHYKVRALDVVGNSAESISLAIDFRSGRKTS